MALALQAPKRLQQGCQGCLSHQVLARLAMLQMKSYNRLDKNSHISSELPSPAAPGHVWCCSGVLKVAGGMWLGVVSQQHNTTLPACALPMR